MDDGRWSISQTVKEIERVDRCQSEMLVDSKTRVDVVVCSCMTDATKWKRVMSMEATVEDILRRWYMVYDRDG